jgi:Ca-activated chloride channel family protein
MADEEVKMLKARLSKLLSNGWPVLLLAFLFSGLLACQSRGTASSSTAPGSGAVPEHSVTAYTKFAPKADRTLTLAFDEWSGTYLPMYVLKVILEDELGYNVQIAQPGSIPGAFDWVAAGQADIFTSAWFPGRNVTFDKYPNLVKLGQVYGGKNKDAYEGWMVSAGLADQYNISHVADLRDRTVVKALDIDGDGRGNLIGCPDTWLCARRGPEMLADYGLTGLYEIEPQRSEQKMLETIAARLRNGQPAFFYLYLPVALPDDISITSQATWLDGTENYLPLSFDRNVVRGDFLVHHPEAATLVRDYRISGADIAWAMAEINKQGNAPEVLTELARIWIAAHQAEVDTWLAGVGGQPGPPTPADDTLVIAYSPEKEALFLDLVARFNRSRPEDTLPIHPVRLEMGQMLDDALDGKFAAMSPDSSVWLNQLERSWQQQNPDASPLVGATARYALSPIVIAMWESRAREMGYPDQALGWEALMRQVSTDPGFKWSHPSASTASGLLVTTAEVYAGAGKSSDLAEEDLADPATLEYVKTIESTVERYGGETEDRIVLRMLAEGGYPLDAFVAQEQLVIYFNQNTTGEKLVAIYPDEGTFWMDHPLVLLDGPWVTEAQRRTFRQFARFVTEPEQQQRVLEAGYRPGVLEVSLAAEGSLITPENGVDPDEPKTLLKMPPPNVLASIREVWRLTKKPANIYLVVDTSGSMSGAKLVGAKSALFSFLDQIEGERDQVALLAFSDTMDPVQGLSELNPEQLSDFRTGIARLEASGGTKLYEAVGLALHLLQQKNDAERINVIVAMTDGQADDDIAVVEQRLATGEIPVLIFTVAYGDDADLEALQQLADMGNGQAYASDPETIEQLYELLSAFF